MWDCFVMPDETNFTKKSVVSGVTQKVNKIVQVKNKTYSHQKASNWYNLILLHIKLGKAKEMKHFNGLGF